MFRFWQAPLQHESSTFQNDSLKLPMENLEGAFTYELGMRLVSVLSWPVHQGSNANGHFVHYSAVFCVSNFTKPL